MFLHLTLKSINQCHPTWFYYTPRPLVVVVVTVSHLMDPLTPTMTSETYCIFPSQSRKHFGWIIQQYLSVSACVPTWHSSTNIRPWWLPQLQHYLAWKVSLSWYYSPTLDGVFCGACTCALLLDKDKWKDNGALVNKPFANWVKLSDVLKTHIKHLYHHDALQSAEVLKSTIENQASRLDVANGQQRATIPNYCCTSVA